MSFPYAEIEEKIGYEFKEKRLLKQAFTHSTYANLKGVESNERMEYLGDAVLELVITEWQYQKDLRAEGALTSARQRYVCRDALDTAVDGLDVYGYLLVKGGARNLGDKSKSNLFEAIVAAIYLDGGYKQARRFILEHGNVRLIKDNHNFKGELQEYLQARGEQPPAYVCNKEGPDHAPVIRCTVCAMGESAFAQGKNRKEAESLAASRLLWELQKKQK